MVGEKKVSVAPPSKMIFKGRERSKTVGIKACRTKVMLPAVSIFILICSGDSLFSPKGEKIISSDPR